LKLFQDDEQFSDDSLEGQVWSSDRDLSSGRDEMVSRGEEPPKEEDENIVKSQSRSSIAWDIDWNEKKDEDNDKGKHILLYICLFANFF
jgi:hypothetical protein